MRDKGHPSRPWREIAKVSKEQNSKRFWELTIELDEDLEAEENKERKPRPCGPTRCLRFG